MDAKYHHIAVPLARLKPNTNQFPQNNRLGLTRATENAQLIVVHNNWTSIDIKNLCSLHL